MAIDRGPQWAIQDKNQHFALIGHSGTAGTAETRRVVLTEEGAVTVADNEVAPTDTTKNNPSFVLTYDGSDQLTQIDLTIGSTTYRKTLTWTDEDCTAISAWSEV